MELSALKCLVNSHYFDFLILNPELCPFKYFFIFAGNRLLDRKSVGRKGYKKLLDIDNALIINVKRPQAGLWKLNVSSNAKHTIRVTGLSTTDFVAGFSRKPVNNMIDTNHRPVAGNSLRIYTVQNIVCNHIPL